MCQTTRKLVDRLVSRILSPATDSLFAVFVGEEISGDYSAGRDISFSENYFLRYTGKKSSGFKHFLPTLVFKHLSCFRLLVYSIFFHIFSQPLFSWLFYIRLRYILEISLRKTKNYIFTETCILSEKTNVCIISSST